MQSVSVNGEEDQHWAWTHHFLAKWSNHLSSLSLSFPICKMVIISVSILQGCPEEELDIMHLGPDLPPGGISVSAVVLTASGG